MNKNNRNKDEDKLNKDIMINVGTSLMKLAGVEDVDIVENLGTETIIKPKSRQADYRGLTSNNREIHVEFQKGKPNHEFNLRMFEYNSTHFIQGGGSRYINSFAFLTDIEKNQTVELEFGDYNTFKYRALTLKSVDGEEYLNNIKAKVKNNEEITEDDIIVLKLILYTSYNRPDHEMMLESCMITKDLPVSHKTKDEIASYQKVLSQKILDKKYHKPIEGVVKMYDNFYKTLEEDYETTIKNIKSDYNIKIADMKSEITNMNKVHKSEIADMNKIHKSEIADMNKVHKSEIANIKNEIANIKNDNNQLKVRMIERLLNDFSLFEIAALVELRIEEVKKIIDEKGLTVKK